MFKKFVFFFLNLGLKGVIEKCVDCFQTLLRGLYFSKRSAAGLGVWFCYKAAQKRSYKHTTGIFFTFSKSIISILYELDISFEFTYF